MGVRTIEENAAARYYSLQMKLRLAESTSRIALVDSNDLVLEGYKRILSNRPYALLVYLSSSPRELIESFDQISPDIIVIDINAHELDALEFLDSLSGRLFDTKIIVNGSIQSATLVKQLLKKGAYTYYVKNETNSDEFLSIIEKALVNEPCYTSVVTESIVFQAFSQSPPSSSMPDFSRRESDILILLCQGKTRDEIARSLFISSHTVKYHIQNLLLKTGLTTVIELVAQSIVKQWISKIKYGIRIWGLSNTSRKCTSS